MVSWQSRLSERFLTALLKFSLLIAPQVHHLIWTRLLLAHLISRLAAQPAVGRGMV